MEMNVHVITVCRLASIYYFFFFYRGSQHLVAQDPSSFGFEDMFWAGP